MTRFLKSVFYIALFSLANPSFLSAQLPKEYKSAFYKGQAKEMTLDRPTIAIRYTSHIKDTNGRTIRMEHWYAPPTPYLSKQVAIQRLNLPGSNTAVVAERVFLPAGTKVYFGKVADGKWEICGLSEIILARCQNW